MISALKNIGLTDSEIKVYFALLELGTSTKGPIVDKSGVASSKIYELLEKLIQKGLVSYVIKDNRKYFNAADPKRILDYLEEKKKQISSQEKEINNLLPQLLLKQKMAKEMKEAEIYEGIKGYQTAREKLLKTMKKGDDMLVIGAPAEVNDKIEAWLLDYHKRREKSGIGMKILYNENAKKYGEQRKTWKHTEVKYMNENVVTPSWIEIFNDNVMINVLAEAPLSFLIHNKDVSGSFKSYFELLWNQKVTVYEGPANVTRFFTNILSDLKPGEEYFVLNGNTGIEDVPEISAFFRNYHKERSKHGIKANFLFNYKVKELAPELALPPSTLKFLPPDFKSPLQITFYKDKLYISVWSKNAVGFLIQSQDVVNAFKAYYDSLWNQDVVVNKGIDNMYATWWKMLDELKPGDEYYVLGANWQGQKEEVPQFFKEFHTKRIEKGVKAKLLFVAGTENAVETHKEFYKQLAETKFLPKGILEAMQINLYKDKVLMFVWREKEPIVFTIDDADVFKTFKSYFDTLWNQDVLTLRGKEGITQLCESVMSEGSDLYFIGANFSVLKTHSDKFKEMSSRFSKTGLKMHVLCQESARQVDKFLEKDNEVRYLPKEFESPMVIWIFGNKVAHVLWDELIVTIVENKRVADDYRTYFDMLWKSSKM